MNINISKINFQILYRYFFYAFLFFIPIQGRKVFESKYTFFTGDFTEYTTFFIYISDLLFIFSLIFFIIVKLKQKDFNKAFLFYEKYNKILTLLTIYILWSIFILILDSSYLEIKTYSILKTLEFSILTIFTINFFSRYKNLVNGLYIITFSACLQSFIGIYQYLSQKSFFSLSILQKISGETILSKTTLGVAKIDFLSEKIVRSYGTFPHPNILGGFLVFSLFISLFLYIEHKQHVLSSIYLYFKIDNKKSQGLIGFIFWLSIFTLQMTALFFSFSRSAWIAIFISLISAWLLYVSNVSRETLEKNPLIRIIKNTLNLIIYNTVPKSYEITIEKYIASHKSILNSPLKYFYNIFLNLFKNIYIVSRETFFTKEKIIKHKELFTSVIIVIIIIISNFSLIQTRIWENTEINNDSQIIKHDTFSDREFYNDVSRETFYQNPLVGSGSGTFIFQMNKYRNVLSDPWQYQPAHNMLLLIASETGIVGLMTMLFIIIEGIKESFSQIVSRETIKNKKLLKILTLSLFLGIIFIGRFDHYLITLQQGKIIFYLIIALLFL